LLSVNKIKQLKSLHKKKYRKEEQLFLLEGYRIINQALLSGFSINEIWLTNESRNSILGNKIVEKLKSKNIPFDIAPNKIIKQISDSFNDQGIIALLPIPKYIKYRKIPDQSIFLDGISDPGNMGTILRTAAWFGVKSIFYSSNCVDPFNSKVIRSSMGAHFYFSHFELNSSLELFKEFKINNIEIFGADMDGEPISSLTELNKKKWVLVLGNEAHGISDDIKEYISTNICIPGNSEMESLNVSIAAGILLYSLV
jgi:TrmH family RNA methyltransferase